MKDALVKLDVGDNGIARITIHNPPVNALSQDVRVGLIAAVGAAVENPDVQAIVLQAEGRTFPAGADLDSLTKRPRAPSLAKVCSVIENSPKPVIVILHGNVLGGGFDLALAAHYRIAAKSTLLGYPEISVGLLPAAGGTQRLPRLVGASAALEMFLIGRPIDASEAARLGIIDRVEAGRVVPAAMLFAQEILDAGSGARRSADRTDGQRDMLANQEAIAKQRNKQSANQIGAAHKVIDCVESAFLLPFEAGLAFEAAAFEECLDSDVSTALRHLYQAEQRAAHIPERDLQDVEPIHRVAIAGGGEIAASFAVACLDGGLSVALAAPSEMGLDAVRAQIQGIYKSLVAERRLGEAMMNERISRLTGSAGLAPAIQADLVIAPLPRDLKAAKTALAPVESAMRAGALLCVVTSDQKVAQLATVCAHPGRLVGLQIPGPAHLTRLVEVSVGPDTIGPIVASTFRFLNRIKRVGLRRKGGALSVAGRLAAAALHAADFMLAEGATPFQIDTAMRGYGMSMGPYQRVDRDGLETSPAGPGLLGIALMDMKWLGRAAGRGYYRYEDGQIQHEQDADVAGILADLRLEHDIDPRPFDDAEIIQRCTAAMANAGARLLDKGVVLRPSDIDVAAVHALGFPRWRGGPMIAADQQGLLNMQHTLLALTEEDPDFWAPSPMFADLIKNGQTFSSVSRSSG